MNQKRRRSYRDFEKSIGNFLKREIDELGLTYQEFSYRLSDHEFAGKSHALLQRLKRGQFSAAFLLAALKALDISDVSVEEILAAKPFDKRSKAKPVRALREKIKKSKTQSKFAPYSESDSWTRKVWPSY